MTDSIPAGFESLTEDQSLFVEVTLDGDRVGTFSDAANVAMRIGVLKLDFDNTAAGIYSGSIVLTIPPL